MKSMPSQKLLQGFPVPAVRRARILKDGQLTMIVYGADEALKWQLRIGKFFGVIRSDSFLEQSSA